MLYGVVDLHRITDNLNPNWTKIIYVESEKSIFFPIRIAIYDDNPKKDEDPLMAEANFEVTDLYESPGNMQYEVHESGAT